MRLASQTISCVAVVLIIFVGLAVLGAHDKNKTVPACTTGCTASIVTAPTYSQDPTLLADANMLGINVSSLNLVYGNLPTGNNDAVPGAGYRGEYDPNAQTIYVVTGQTQANELQTLAYEYMHYVWGSLVGASFQQQEGPLLEQYEANNPALQQNMAQYSGSQATIENELDSTVCTEVDPSLLSSGFNAYCDQYIPNRSLLF